MHLQATNAGGNGMILRRESSSFAFRALEKNLARCLTGFAMGALPFPALADAVSDFYTNKAITFLSALPQVVDMTPTRDCSRGISANTCQENRLSSYKTCLEAPG
jgi:hypothetical protein